MTSSVSTPVKYVDDPLHAPCGISADRADPRMRMRTAHDAEGECARKPNVVDEPAAPLEELRVLDSAQRLTDHAALILLERDRLRVARGGLVQKTRGQFAHGLRLLHVRQVANVLAHYQAWKVPT